MKDDEEELKVELMTRQGSLSKKLLFFLVTSFLLIGVVMRFHNLGKSGFWLDELFHVYAAESILKDGKPTILGEDGEYVLYKRGYPFTYITALFFKWFGNNETVARIPPVLFNIIFIIAGFFFVKQFFSTDLALLFSFVMLLSPLEIVLSRECRMYSLFQLLYFLASFVFFLGFEGGVRNSHINRNNPIKIFEKKYDISLSLLLFGAILFYFSSRIHLETFGFAVTLISYCAIMGCYLFFQKGAKSLFLSKYFAVLCLGALGLVTFTLVFPEKLNKLLGIGLNVPWFKIKLEKSYHYYIAYFLNNYSAFAFIYPLSMYFMIKNHGKRGVFILCSFLPLVMMHNFVFGRKGSRYILYIYPFFIIGSAYFITFIFPYIRDIIRIEKVKNSKVMYSILIICLFSSINIFTYPWLKNTFKEMKNPTNLDWKSMADPLKVIPQDGVIVTPNRLEILYYSGKFSQYILRVGEKNKAIENRIQNVNQLNEIIENREDIYVIADIRNFSNDNVVSNDMRLLIYKKLLPVEHNGDGRILIFKKGRRG